MTTKRKIMAISIPLAILLIATIILATVTSGFTNWSRNTGNNYQEEIDTGNAVDNNGSEMLNGNSYAMPANMMFASATPMSMETTAASGITLTATITPASASDKKVDWAVSWVNPNSTFATGKTVTDYLTATPTSDGSLTATVNCLQSFGEKIKITVTSRNNEAATAECTVDYARRLSSTQLNVSYSNSSAQPFSFTTTTQTLNLFPIINPQPWYQIYGSLTTNCTNEFVHTYSGNYTVNNEVLSTKAEIKASTELINALNAQGMTSDCANWQTLSTVSFADIIFSLGGVSNMSNGGFLNTTNYNKLLTAFAATTSSDFQLRITVTTRYGDPVVTTYTCHYSHASAGLAVESITLESDTLIV